ncbi:MAG: methionine--tRNA ligase subunit beta [Phycisphaerae bacterium]
MSDVRPAKPLVDYDDFTQLDLRVARVLECREHPNADKLLILKIDLGTEGGQRQICAGLRHQYKPEEMVGKQIVVVANLAPRSMRGEQSQGMLLAATDTTNALAERVVVITPMSEVPPGSVVS